MSIINNAHSGSSIVVLCIIDRFLNNKKMSPVKREELLELCRPNELPQSGNAEKKFKETLNFWLDYGLWCETDDGIQASSDTAYDENLANRVLKTCIRECTNKDITDANGTTIEPLMRTLSCLMAQDEFAIGGRPLTTGEGSIKSAIRATLPIQFSVNSNEVGTLRDYAEFLGFIEPVSNNEYVLDPTRAILSVITEVFEEQAEINITDFIERLAKLQPLLDGGKFRTQVEMLMRDQGWEGRPSHKLSASLSFALLRLEAAEVLALSTKSDDENQLLLTQNVGNQSRWISKVVLREKRK